MSGSSTQLNNSTSNEWTSEQFHTSSWSSYHWRGIKICVGHFHGSQSRWFHHNWLWSMEGTFLGASRIILSCGQGPFQYLLIFPKHDSIFTLPQTQLSDQKSPTSKFLSYMTICCNLLWALSISRFLLGMYDIKITTNKRETCKAVD